MSEIDEIVAIEDLLDLDDAKIKGLYDSWDKGDCSLVGIIEIYLCQTIMRHKLENGEYYDTDFDKIRLRYEL